MTKLQILLTLFQLFGPVMSDAWPLIKELLDILKKAPAPKALGRTRFGRSERVEKAQREELKRLAEEAGVESEEVEQAIA